MKKLAARDFEDLLQVRQIVLFNFMYLTLVPVFHSSLRGFIAAETRQNY